MIEISVLGSGSSGNCTFIGNENSAILVDAGFSGREILDRLERVSIDKDRVNGIIITHNHRDHICGAGIIARKLNIPIYISRPNYNVSKKYLGKSIRPIFLKVDNKFSVGEIDITPFQTEHDSTHSVGFTIDIDNKKIGFATDLGVVTDKVIAGLTNCNTILLESNHDPEMLTNGPYPKDLQERIRGNYGHISNGEAQEIISRVIHPKLENVVLLHLSDDNNSIENASKMSAIINNNNTKLIISTQNTPIEPIYM